MKPKAYEGNENYIFVSYSHKDTEKVFEVMCALEKAGYRLWYDDGIIPGSEWPENIAQHLNGAAMVIAMITPNSMESHNCRREINFALAKMKPFLSVVLEPTQMSLGMEMQLSAQHNILRYNYENWDDFIHKILSCPDIEPCKIDISTPDRESEPVATEIPIKEPEKKKEKPKQVKKEKKKRPWKKNLGIAAAVAAAAVLSLFLINKGTTVQLSTGDTVSKSESYIYLYKDTLTQDDLEALAGLKQVSHFELEDCDLSACDFTDLSFASPEVDYLSFSGCTGINDYAFLKNLTLTSLYLDGCTGFTNLAELDLSQMVTLNLNDTGVTDLSCLEGTTVQNLYFDRTGVSDITALGTLTELHTVSGNDCVVTSIDALAGLENLSQISFSGCPIEMVSATFQSLRMTKISLANCGVTDLSGFRDVTQLTTLDIKNNPVLTDLSWLDAQNYDTLETVCLGGTGLTAEQIAFLVDCPAVKCLDLNGITLTDLSVCEGKQNLKTLYAAGCGLTDISALATCESLQDAILSFNSITDVSPLAMMMQNDYPSIDLSYNAVSDISSLQGSMDILLLHGNADNVVQTMSEGLATFYLSVEWYAGIEDSSLATADSLYLYLLDCPNNQKLNLQEKISGVYLEFITADQLYEIIQQEEMFAQDELDYSYCMNLYQTVR